MSPRICSSLFLARFETGFGAVSSCRNYLLNLVLNCLGQMSCLRRKSIMGAYFQSVSWLGCTEGVYAVGRSLLTQYWLWLVAICFQSNIVQRWCFTHQSQRDFVLQPRVREAWRANLGSEAPIIRTLKGFYLRVQPFQGWHLHPSLKTQDWNNPELEDEIQLGLKKNSTLTVWTICEWSARSVKQMWEVWFPHFTSWWYGEIEGAKSISNWFVFVQKDPHRDVNLMCILW